MCYLVDVATTIQVADALSLVLNLPAHQADDVLLAFLSKDDAAGGAFTGMSGWTEIAQANVGTSGTNTVRGAAFWKRASGPSETPPTVASTDTDAWCAAVVCVRGAYAADNPIGTYATNTDSSGAPYTGNPSQAVDAYEGGLYFVMGACDGGVSMAAYPDEANTLVSIDSASNGLVVAWRLMDDTTDPPPAVNFYGAGTADETAFVAFSVMPNAAYSDTPALQPMINLRSALIHPLMGTAAVFSGDAAVTNNNAFVLLNKHRAPGAVRQWDESTNTFVDYTAAAGNATTADVLPFPASEAIGDCLYLGDASPFGGVWIDRTSCTAGVAGVVQWQYWNGTAWAALPKIYDQTAGFTAAVSTYHALGFEVPADWATTTVNGYSGYFIRARVTTVYTTNPTLTRLYLGDHATYYDAAASVADSGVNPFHASIDATPGNTGRIFGGNLFGFGANKDVSFANGILMGTFRFALPRDYIDVGPRKHGGVLAGIVDASYNMKLWTVGAYGDQDTRADARMVYAIQLDQSTDTSFFQTASAPTRTAFRYFPVLAMSYEGGCSVQFSQLLWSYGSARIWGGGPGRPITFPILQWLLQQYPFPHLQGNTLYKGLTFGSGDMSTYVDLSEFYLEFPEQATAASNASKWHVDPDQVGVTIEIGYDPVFYENVVDVCKLRNGTLAGKSSWRFEISDGSPLAASAVYDFTGLNLVNANVKLRDVTTFTGMGFLKYTAFDAQGCDLLRCTFSRVPAASGSALFSASSTVKECTIDVSGVASGHYWCSVASPAIFEDNTFVGGGGHAIRITTPGTYAFQGNTLAGFGADGSNGAFFLNDSGGAVTINVSGGGSTPSVKNGTGASTTIVAGAQVTLTGLQPGSEVRAYVGTDPASATEIAGVESSGTSFGFAQAVAGQAGYLVVHALGYLPIRLELVYAASDQTLPVQQQVDRQYQNAA